LIEEASARSYNKYIIALLRSGSTGEYSILGFGIGPLYGRANTASLELNILLYCPPTHAIIIYIYYWLHVACVLPVVNLVLSQCSYIAMESTVVLFSYLMIISDVDISSLLNQVHHCVDIAPPSCHMQGSPLKERNKATTTTPTVTLTAICKSNLIAPESRT